MMEILLDELPVHDYLSLSLVNTDLCNRLFSRSRCYVHFFLQTVSSFIFAAPIRRGGYLDAQGFRTLRSMWMGGIGIHLEPPEHAGCEFVFWEHALHGEFDDSIGMLVEHLACLHFP